MLSFTASTLFSPGTPDHEKLLTSTEEKTPSQHGVVTVAPLAPALYTGASMGQQMPCFQAVMRFGEELWVLHP